MLDTQFRFVRINRQLAELNGLPREAHIGKTPRELFPSLPHDELEAGWRRVLETAQPILGFEFCGETPAAPGRTRWWREDWFPVRVLGDIVGISVVVLEVTDEKRRAELQRLLVGIVGHDLRNPLSVIKTAATLLRTGADATEQQQKLARKIEKAVTRIDLLARDLLDYTVITHTGRLPVTPAPSRMGKVVHAMADEVRAAYPAALIECEGDPEMSGEWDEHRIQQLVGNLLTNAAKYGAPGERIRAQWRADADGVALEIHNVGEPIPAERLSCIFDAVWQGHRDSHGGIGLGLFISHEIARSHGGSIAVSSTREDGTTFRVWLPRQAPPGAG